MDSLEFASRSSDYNRLGRAYELWQPMEEFVMSSSCSEQTVQKLTKFDVTLQANKRRVYKFRNLL